MDTTPAGHPDKPIKQADPYNLLDGATGSALDVMREVRDLREVTRDGNRSMEERLEAYEDIIDSEIGDTNLVRAYGQIAYEIYDELRDAPLAVAVPVSNGTTLPADRYVAVLTGRKS